MARQFYVEFELAKYGAFIEDIFFREKMNTFGIFTAPMVKELMYHSVGYFDRLISESRLSQFGLKKRQKISKISQLSIESPV